MLLSCPHRMDWESLNFLSNETEMWFQVSKFGFIINNSIVRSFTTIVFIQLAWTWNSIYYLGAVWSYIHAANMHLYVPDPSQFLFFWEEGFTSFTKESNQIINQGEAIADNRTRVSSKAFTSWRSEGLCDWHKGKAAQPPPALPCLCSGMRAPFCRLPAALDFTFVPGPRDASAA